MSKAYNIEKTDDNVSAHEVHAVDIDSTPSIKTLEQTERETIIEALNRNRGKRKKTAEELNISERTLYRKIKEYGLESQ